MRCEDGPAVPGFSRPSLATPWGRGRCSPEFQRPGVASGLSSPGAPPNALSTAYNLLSGPVLLPGGRAHTLWGRGGFRRKMRCGCWRRGRGCRAGRRVDDQRPARFRAYSAPETGKRFPRRPGLQSGCDRDSTGLPRLFSSPPGRLSAVTSTWTPRSRRTSACDVGVTAQPATLSRASLRPMTSAEVGSSRGLQTVQTGVCRLPLRGVLLSGAALRRCDLVLRP